MIKFIFMSFIFLIFGCASDKSYSVIYKNTSKKDPIVKKELIFMDEKAKKELLDSKDAPYKFNNGDRLLITVFGHPEFSTPNGAGGESEKTLVDTDGMIQLPRIGTIHAAGLTALELKKIVVDKLKYYLIDPKVIVSVAHFRGLKYFLLGEFNNPGVKVSTTPLSLIEVLSLANGVKLDTANLRGTYIIRNNKKLPVNLYRLLKEGDMSQNIMLKNRDTIFVTDNTNETAYVIGEVAGQPYGRTVKFKNGQLTVLQVISDVGYSANQDEYGTLANVHIIRSEPDRVEHFVINVEDVLHGKALSFYLVPGDVVYIPKSDIGSFNMLTKKIAPIFNLIKTMISPVLSYQNIQ